MKMKFAKILLLVVMALSLGACREEEEEEKTQPNAGTTLNAGGIASISSLGTGWNLGNTFDANSTGDKTNKGLSSETSWGMPKTTKAMIDAVAAKGIKVIRIPVSWHNHIQDSKYTIDPLWLSRVKEVVDWALKDGMSVIINIHHDNLSEGTMSSTYGFCIPESNESLKKQSLDYIKTVWKQISLYFKGYDNRLMFEVLNEPRAVGKTYEWNAAGQPEKIRAANVLIKEYEQAALDTIRSTGGNNAVRYLLIPPYAASPYLMDGWSLPKDSASGRLIVSVHAYTPFEFCMDTMSVKNFTNSHKSSIDWLFNVLNTNFISKGLPVIIGEASASDKNNTAERKKWTEYYFTKAKALGISVVLWDNMVTYPNGNDAGERHGWFNRNNLTWFFPELVDLMVK